LVWPKLALTAAAQLRWQLLNANALILCDYDETSALTTAKKAISLAKARQPVALAKHSLRLGRSLPELLLRGSHSVMTGLAPVFTAKQVMLKTHVEQVPDADNRIRLSPERDKFGQPRAQLTWRIHPYELKTMAGITQAVGAELQRLGFGTMTNAAWLDQPPSMAQAHIEDTYHHAGTTRMAATSSAGVVDPECRVFGVANLFVAGGSVFPTSGYANPTLTIVALAIRLGDTLKRHYGGERMAPPPVASSPQPALFQCERESATGCGPRA
jgi:choline dehydrogenase-like flavoprotein